MERIYQNHVEVPPATDSWFYLYEDPEPYILQNEPFNRTRPIHYYDYSPVSYEPMPVFLHRGGYMTNTCQSYSHGATSAANLLPSRLQFYYIQRPMFNRNLVRFQANVPVASTARSLSWTHNNDDRYSVYHPNVHSRRVYSHSDGYPCIDSSFFHLSSANANFSSCLLYMGDLGWTHNNDGIIQGTYHDASSIIQSNIFPMAQGCLQENFPNPDDSILTKYAIGDVRHTDEDPYGGYEGSFSAPMPFGLGQPVLPGKNNARLCEKDLSYKSVRKKPNERNSSKQQHGYKNRVETNPTKSSVAPSTSSRTKGRTSSAKQSGQRRKTQSDKSTQSIRDPASPSISGNQMAPCQVWQKKTKVQPSASQSGRSRKPKNPIFHITWDGFDEQSESVGQSCHLCNQDLSYAPTDNEFDYCDLLDEPANLPDVSVLSCGHAFHSHCLQLITPEEHSRDPACYLCISAKI